LDITLFPTNGFGSVLFSRKEIVKSVCDTLITKRTLFLRSPPGSGKSVFLNLLGSHLQGEGCRVYFFTGSHSFVSQSDAVRSTIIANKKEGCKIVILVDEINTLTNFDDRLWLNVLKPECNISRSFKNVFVVAAGVSTTIEFSKLFDVRFDSQLLFFKSESNDLEEVIAYWQRIAPLDIISSHQVADIVKFIRHYTGGHPYPFFKYCQAFFCNENISNYITNPQSYLCSHELFKSEIIQECLQRCNYQNIRPSDVKKIIFYENGYEDSIHHLSKTGFWNLEERNFSSSLVLNVFYNSGSPSYDLPTRDELSTKLKNDPLLHRIYAGFCRFKEVDFAEFGFEGKILVENAISAKWGFYLHMHMSHVFISSQARVSTPNLGPGAVPTVDFLLNGRDLFAVEFSLNGYDIKNKIQKFEVGCYKEWKNKYAIVNIITKSKNIFGSKSKKRTSESFVEDQALEDIGDSIQNVYQFNTQTNKLYKGTKLVISSVSVHLPSFL
jgi:hypothetical protein